MVGDHELITTLDGVTPEEREWAKQQWLKWANQPKMELMRDLRSAGYVYFKASMWRDSKGVLQLEFNVCSC